MSLQNVFIHQRAQAHHFSTITSAGSFCSFLSIFYRSRTRLVNNKEIVNCHIYADILHLKGFRISSTTV
ncbi:hypothetical protein XENTR_v10013792 [Xenopus tropicalis]|nr:hypothetical protein XENTR_v10013792 [Xenopus tropicalis]